MVFISLRDSSAPWHLTVLIGILHNDWYRRVIKSITPTFPRRENRRNRFNGEHFKTLCRCDWRDAQMFRLNWHVLFIIFMVQFNECVAQVQSRRRWIAETGGLSALWETKSAIWKQLQAHVAIQYIKDGEIIVLMFSSRTSAEGNFHPSCDRTDLETLQQTF